MNATEVESIFLEDARIPAAHQKAAIALLRTVVTCTGWPAEGVAASVGTADIVRGMLLGFDGLMFEMYLEQQTGIKLSGFSKRMPVFVEVRSRLPEHRPPKDLGDWVRRAAAELQRTIDGPPPAPSLPR